VSAPLKRRKSATTTEDEHSCKDSGQCVCNCKRLAMRGRPEDTVEWTDDTARVELGVGLRWKIEHNALAASGDRHMRATQESRRTIERNTNGAPLWLCPPALGCHMWMPARTHKPHRPSRHTTVSRRPSMTERGDAPACRVLDEDEWILDVSCALIKTKVLCLRTVLRGRYAYGRTVYGRSRRTSNFASSSLCPLLFFVNCAVYSIAV
jgi:hypothetical protein